MKSARSKVLHELFGKPMIEYCLETVSEIGIDKSIVVAGRNRGELESLLGKRAEIVFQKERLGTGHALMSARPKLRGFDGELLVLAADAPLIRPETLRDFAKSHREHEADASILAAELENPEGYGRILRDESGNVVGIREDLEATRAEKEIREVNSSIYLFDSKKVFGALENIKPSRLKKEYYLTDAVEFLVKNGSRVKAYPLAEGEELLGINTRKDLALAAREIWKRNIDFYLERGVTIVSPENTYIESGAAIGTDTVIFPFTYIEKHVKIGKNCRVGPFCKIRSGSTVKDRAVVGSFVEIVRSSIGKNTLVKHLAYLGDALVGNNVNIGAGTITANFDGKKKNKTRIGDKAFIGCDTIAIAPVSIGRGAKTGAGTVIPQGKNVPANSTVVGIPARILRKK